MAIMTITIGEKNMFQTLDTVTFTNVDVVILRALPEYARQNTARIDDFVRVFDDAGTELPEIMDGDIDLPTSIGSFTVGSSNMIRIAFEKGKFANTEEARQGVSKYRVTFQLTDTASYVVDSYDVKIFDLGTGTKTFDSIIIGDQQLLALMKSHIGIADLSLFGMNPFRIEIYPLISP